MSILDLQWILDGLIDGTVKGFPGTHRRLALREIGAQGWNLLEGAVPLPAAVLKRSALERNRRWMARFLEQSGVRLAPHGKTTMSPQLFELQLQDGAWGITCATVEQLQVYRRCGVPRVLMANQLVGRASIEYVVSELDRDPRFEFHCLVDSVDGVRHIVAEAQRCNARRPVSMLVELGVAGGRTGARTEADAVAIGREIAAHPQHARLGGLETYERIVPAASPEQLESGVRSLLNVAAGVAARLDAAGLFRDTSPIIVSAGGTEFFDLAAGTLAQLRLSQPVLPLIRSGCYLTVDHVNYGPTSARVREQAQSPELRTAGPTPALEVWGCVQSRPESTRAFVMMGKRDVSYDLHMPTPIGWVRPGEGGVRAVEAGTKVTALNDQHAYLELPAGSALLKVGDLVGFGISHPCTTFDKWQLIYIVDDDYAIVDAVRTFF